MLMKLLKYEWKTTARVLLPVGAGVLGFSLLTGLMNLLLDYPKLPEVVGWLKGTVSVLAVLALIFVAGAVVFVNVQRFYRLLGEQGYLMFSLPVPVWQHIAAKLLCACVWAVLCVPYLIVCSSLLNMDFTWLWSGWSGLTWDPWGVAIVLQVSLVLLAAVCCGYLHMYLCCAIGAQFGQQRLLASIVSYFVLGFVEQIAGTLLMILLAVSMVQSNAWQVWSQALSQNAALSSNLILLVLLVGMMLFSAVLWAVTQWLMTRRLNLV